MSQDIEKVMQRTQRYYYEDGLVETAVSLLFIVIGLALLGWLTIQTSPVLGIVMVFVSMGVIMGGTLFVQRVIPFLKERITHPRTGAVTYRRDVPSRSRWVVIGFALLLPVLGFVFPEFVTQMSGAVGLLLGVVLSLIGYRVRLPRFYFLGIAAMLAGIGAASLFDNDITSTAFTFGTVGLLMFVVGLTILWQYIRRHPVAEVDYE